MPTDLAIPERIERLPEDVRRQLLQTLLSAKASAKPAAPSPSKSSSAPAEAPRSAVPAEPVEVPGFMEFKKRLWPGFLEGRHHAALANAFERIAKGTLRRLIINMAPRHGKSEDTSVYLPAWYLGQFPQRKVILATHTESLSRGFARRVRNIVRDWPEFHEMFPGCTLAKDAKAATRWATQAGGEFFALGAGGALAGHGAHLFIIDDPHSEQDGLSATDTHWDSMFDWYCSGPRQRLQPGGAIVVNMTRWSKKDLTGKLLESMKDHLGEQWEVISLPAILPSGEALFPQFWPLIELERIKRTLPARNWNAQYQQNPTSEEGAIVKREWWKKWEGRPPRCEFTIQSWDTSFGEFKRGDPSACVDWGVFKSDQIPGAPKGAPPYQLLLMDSFSARLEFPHLKAKALELYRLKKPDTLCIEARAAGESLIQELRHMGLPIARYAPTSGKDKLTRMNAVSDLFSSGLVWYLDTVKNREVIDEFACADASTHDDLADASVQALQRFRDGGFVKLETDDAGFDDASEDEKKWRPWLPKEGAYY